MIRRRAGHRTETFSSNMHNPDDAEAFRIYAVHPDGSGLRSINLAQWKESLENRYMAGSFSSRSPSKQVECYFSSVVYFNDKNNFVTKCDNKLRKVSPPKTSTKFFDTYLDIYVQYVSPSILEN